MLRVTSPLAPEVEQLVTQVIDIGFTVHNVLGPGFREPIYEKAFCLELDARGLTFECQKAVDVVYKQWRIPGQRIDLIVEGTVLVELKAVKKLKEIHRRQVIAYLKTTDLPIGILMNFNTVLFKNGVRRVLPYKPK